MHPEMERSFNEVVRSMDLARINRISAPCWQPIETAPRDKTEVHIKTNIGVVSAWFHRETGEAYEWVCYDDKFTVDGADGSVTHWMPIPAN